MSAAIRRIKANTEEEACSQLAEELGTSPSSLRCVEHQKDVYAFEVLSCPPAVEVEVSRNAMQAKITRLRLPVGEGVPRLTTDFVVNALRDKGVVKGIKHEVITAELFKIISDANFDETQSLDWVVAEGVSPVAGQIGRPQWDIDLKLFQKNKRLFGKKGEVVARAPIAMQGQDGFKVTGETIEAEYEDPFELPVGDGIAIERQDSESLYKLQYSGELIYERGVRLKVEAKVLDLDDGLRAAVVIDQRSFRGAKFHASDLLEMAVDNGVVFGALSSGEIQAEMNQIKKWPARVTVALGKEPVDGKPGEVHYSYTVPTSARKVDDEKAKLGMVFPGEVIAVIDSPSQPVHGSTVFGETLKGRMCNELPVYPGKNVKKEALGDKLLFKSTIYGKVKKADERITCLNPLKISQDAMKVEMDLFPQSQLSFSDVLGLMKDKDVLFGYDEEKLEEALDKVYRAGVRVPHFLVAEGRPVKPGKNAKLDLFFDPNDLQESGIIIKKKPRKLLAAPNDVLALKTLPIEAEDGVNVYRERLPVPRELRAKDIEIESGRNVTERLLGEEGSHENPHRIEYRASSFGILSWSKRVLDLASGMEVSKNDAEVSLMLLSKSSFGTPIDYKMIEEYAKKEGIRVALEERRIRDFLRNSASDSESDPKPVLIARSIPPEHGEDAEITYYVQINGEDVGSFLQPGKGGLEHRSCDCVRPNDIVAVKKPPGDGKDGLSVFGRRLRAERGADEPWRIGPGLEKSEDGLQLVVSLETPGYVMAEDARLTVQNPIQVSRDKMSALLWLYPSTNPRFQPREEKILGMVHGRGIQVGIQKERIREGLERCHENQEPVEVLVAEGKEPVRGRDASYQFALEGGASATETREDGSVDYKAAGVFQSVKKNQLLLIKYQATAGESGFNIFGEKLSGLLGEDRHVEPGEGVEVSADGSEYHAVRDGIVEYTGDSIRVIEGLFVESDVDYKTGSIYAESTPVFVRGSVLPGFLVTSEKDVRIDGVAEACEIYSRGSVSVQGGIIGKEKAYVRAGDKVESLYISSGATVEATGDIVVGSEVLNSQVRTGGMLRCEEGAGTLRGGEVWAYQGVSAKILGSPGSERNTIIYLGVDYLQMEAAKQRIEEEGLEEKGREVAEQISALDAELKTLYEEIPKAMQSSAQEGRRLQEQYRELYQKRKSFEEEAGIIQKQKDVILGQVPKNKKFEVRVENMVHPGVTLIFQGVVWKLKEPLRAVQIIWNDATSNLISRRLG